MDIEKQIEKYLETIPDTYTWNPHEIYARIRELAEMMKVKPADINLAIDYMARKGLHKDTRNVILDLLTLHKYLELCSSQQKN